MKTYVSRKTVKAKPMTRQEYNDFRGWDLPKDEDGNDKGYLVEYSDGGKPNTPHYAGYVSWSPAEQFENASQIAETPQDRVIGEREEVMERLEKLTAFLAKGRPSFISKDEWDSLFDQRIAMTEYHDILTYRMDLHKAGRNE